jgi:hypothetical protein
MNDYRQAMPAPKKGRDGYRPRDCQEKVDRKSCFLVNSQRGKDPFESRSNGLKDLFEPVNRLRTSLRNASIADQIVEKAAAFLFVYSRANSVFAVTISEKGPKFLEQNHVSAEFQNIVPNVPSKERTEVCPFEKMVLNCRDAKEAFGILGKVFKQTE